MRKIRKIITKSCSLILAFVICFGSISLHAFANYIPSACPTCGQHDGTAYETTDTAYVAANDQGHLRRTKYVFICGSCHIGWEDYLYFNEPHSTPNNQPCACGFVPHQ